MEGDLQLCEDPRAPIDVFPFEVQDPHPPTPMTVLPVLPEVGQKTVTEAVECDLWSAREIWNLLLTAGLPVLSAVPLVF